MDYSQLNAASALTLIGVPQSRFSAAVPIPTPRHSGTPTEAAVVHLDDNQFFNKLEKHIDDYYRGRGELSRGVSAELGQRESYAASGLDPKNALLFGSYLGALSYGQRSRFISGVSSSVDDIGSLLNTAG